MMSRAIDLRDGPSLHTPDSNTADATPSMGRGSRMENTAAAFTSRGRKRALHPTILRAASDMFAQSGFEQPTLTQIATAAGVTKATLYVYFDGKADLINAVIDSWLRDVADIKPTRRDMSLKQQLVDAGRQLLALAAHPATVAMTKRVDEIERRIAPSQLGAWRARFSELEANVAEILKKRCHGGEALEVAHQFNLLITGGRDLAAPGSLATDESRIERAVAFVMRAYPG